MEFDTKAAREIRGVRLVRRSNHSPNEMDTDIWVHVFWVHPDPSEAAQTKFPPWSSWLYWKSLPTFYFFALWDAFAQASPAESAPYQATFDRIRNNASAEDDDDPYALPEMPAFSEVEQQRLRQLVALHGPHDWVKISEQVGRSSVECRAYFSQHFLNLRSDEMELILQRLDGLSIDDLKALCQSRKVSWSDSVEISKNRLRMHLCSASKVSRAEKTLLEKLLQEHGHDYGTIRAALLEKSYQRGLHEVENIVFVMFLMTPEAKAEAGLSGIRSTARAETFHERAEQTAYGASSLPSRVSSRERVSSSAALAAAAELAAERADGLSMDSGPPLVKKKRTRRKKNVGQEGDGEQENSAEGQQQQQQQQQQTQQTQQKAQKVQKVAEPGSTGKGPGRKSNIVSPDLIPSTLPTALVKRRHLEGSFVEYLVSYEGKGVKTPMKCWLDVVDLVDRFRVVGAMGKQEIINMIEFYDNEKNVAQDIHSVVGEKVEGGVPLYKIRWIDYPDQFCTWEVRENLGRSEYKVDEFLERRARNEPEEENPVSALTRPVGKSPSVLDDDGAPRPQKQLPKPQDRVKDVEDDDDDEHREDEDDNDDDDDEEDEVFVDSGVRKKADPVYDNSITCETCGRKCAGFQGLAVHSVKAHGIRLKAGKPLTPGKPVTPGSGGKRRGGNSGKRGLDEDGSVVGSGGGQVAEDVKAPSPSPKKVSPLSSGRKKGKKAATAEGGGAGVESVQKVVEAATLFNKLKDVREWLPFSTELKQVLTATQVADMEKVWKKNVQTKLFPVSVSFNVSEVSEWMSRGKKIGKLLKKDKVAKATTLLFIFWALLAPFCANFKSLSADDAAHVTKWLSQLRSVLEMPEMAGIKSLKEMLSRKVAWLESMTTK